MTDRNMHFENIIFIGRPASGKSEFISYLKTLDIKKRSERFNVGEFKEIDDWPWLWEKFIEDDMWAELGYPRIYSKRYDNEDRDIGVDPKHLEIFDLMMKKINYEIFLNYSAEYYANKTLFIEFSRGGRNAYQKSLNYLSSEILERSSIVYNKVSHKESIRKNLQRYQEKKKVQSWLAHKTPDELMEVYYNIDDWDDITNGKMNGVLTIKDVQIPYVTINNEPETTDPKILEERYSAPLKRLWELYKSVSS